MKRGYNMFLPCRAFARQQCCCKPTLRARGHDAAAYLAVESTTIVTMIKMGGAAAHITEKNTQSRASCVCVSSIGFVPCPLRITWKAGWLPFQTKRCERLRKVTPMIFQPREKRSNEYLYIEKCEYLCPIDSNCRYTRTVRQHGQVLLR